MGKLYKKYGDVPTNYSNNRLHGVVSFLTVTVKQSLHRSVQAFRVAEG